MWSCRETTTHRYYRIHYHYFHCRIVRVHKLRYQTTCPLQHATMQPTLEDKLGFWLSGRWDSFVSCLPNSATFQQAVWWWKHAQFPYCDCCLDQSMHITDWYLHCLCSGDKCDTESMNVTPNKERKNNIKVTQAWLLYLHWISYI